MSLWAMRMCSSSSQAECGAPWGRAPMRSSGKPRTTSSNFAWAWPPSSNQIRCSRTGRSADMVCLLDDTAAPLRFQPDLAESGLVLVDVLLQHVQKRFGLLRADVDALKVLDGDVIGSSLVHTAEQKEEIPQVYAHLHAVRVAFTVIGRAIELDFGSRRLRHSFSVAPPDLHEGEPNMSRRHLTPVVKVPGQRQSKIFTNFGTTFAGAIASDEMRPML